jgi:hypothetical protein
MSLSVMALTSTTQQYGADTLRIMTLSMMTHTIMALGTTTLSRMIHSKVLLCLKVTQNNDTHHIDAQHSDAQHNNNQPNDTQCYIT